MKMIRTRAALLLALVLTAAPVFAQETATPTRPRFVTLTPVNFATGLASIDPKARQALARVAEILAANTDARVVVVGHADERGSDAFNERLGQWRAEAVLEQLVEAGIERTRFEARSAGEREPLDRAHNEAAWRQNRRVEFRVVGDTPLRLPGR